MESINIIGVSDFKVNKVQLKLRDLIMNINIHWPILKLKLNSYNIDGIVMNFMIAKETGNAE